MATIDTFPKTQPQVAQLECLFKAPLVKDSAVETFNELLLMNPNYNYKHKLVWVRDQASNYYLENGDGTNAINWKRSISRAVIAPYNQEEEYQFGETVYLGGKLYSATQSVPKYYTPLSYPAYWKVISGETITYRFLFFNTSSVLVYTEVRNPLFEIILGEIPLDVNGIPEIDTETGLVIINNAEIIEAVIQERKDLPQNNGIAYEISFYSDSELNTQLSGCINIK